MTDSKAASKNRTAGSYFMPLVHFAVSFVLDVPENSPKNHTWFSVQVWLIELEAIETHWSKTDWIRKIQATSKSEKNAALQNNKTFLTPVWSKTIPPLREKLFRKKYKAIANNLYYVKS